MKTIYLIRHGHYVNHENVEGGVLTSIGRRQAQALREVLRGKEVHELYSSMLGRAMETAQIVQQAFPALKVEHLSYLNEISPKFRGFRQEIQSYPPQKLGLLGKKTTPTRQLTQIEERFFSPAQFPHTVLVFCHGNVIRSLYCRLHAIPYARWDEFSVFHCSMSIFQVSEQGVTTIAYNQVDHLPVGLRTEC